jgi:arylsulfatase A-like enzyme
MSLDHWRLLGMLFGAALLLSCGRITTDSGEDTAYDLVDDIGFSQRIVETTSLDLGAPGSGADLLYGWSHIERSGVGDNFRWAVGEGSGTRFHLVSRRDLELEMVMRPFRIDDNRAQAVEVSVNGSSIGSLQMRREWYRYRVAVPASVLRTGENTLDVRYSYWWEPQPGKEGPRRRLAVAWKRIRIVEPLTAATEPAAVENGEALFLPAGNRVEYFLDVPARSSFRIDEVRPTGKSPGRLILATTVDGEEEVVLLDQEKPASAIDLPLIDGRRGIARLSLTVEPKTHPGARDGFLLTRPRLVSQLGAEREFSQVPSSGGATPTTKPPNILIYLVDTLRTDAVGTHEPKRATSPSFDRFAADAAVFENAIGQSSWTRASVASLFTGLLPQRHGAIDRLDILADDARTLAELLDDAGYTNAAFITNPNVTGKFGFAQGFDDFFHIRTYRASDEVNQRVFAWLDENTDARPFFLYVHTMDPHHPYLPPEPMRPAFAPAEEDMRALTRLLAMHPPPPDLIEQVDRLRALYDAAARFNDQSFGHLIDVLADRGLMDETVVIFVSDHGEEFFEHGDWQHGKNLHVETLSVPLAMKFPGVEGGRRIPHLTGHVDVLPTLLDYLGLPPVDGMDGRSVLPLLTGLHQSAPGSGRAFAHLSLDGHESVAVVDGNWKLIVVTTETGARVHRLYDWMSDRGETRNRAAEHPIIVRYLESLIERELASGPAALVREEAEIDRELEQSLRALGYLQ